MVATLTPYSTVAPLFQGVPTWIPEDEQERLAAYQKYEEIYWNVPDAFKLYLRGDETKPLQIPNAMTVVDTTAHYFLKGLTLAVSEPDRDKIAAEALTAFLRRERFRSKFQIAKHSGVARGDFVFHLTGDPLAVPGRRLSINSVDPGAYFPIFDDDDLDKKTAVLLVQQFIDGDGETRIKRLRYSYETTDGRRRVFREEAVFSMDDWGGPESEPIRTLIPRAPLDERITTIPVYHFKNRDWEGQPFGSSEIRGHERLLAGVTQTASDEELALALDGLGVYVTNAPAPRDTDGKEIAWEVFPGVVLKVSGEQKFDRIKGVDSIQPMLDHVRYVEEKLFESSGTSDVARGRVDVTTAESGIALAIKFLPTMAKIEERDQSGLDVLTNLFFDWKFWHRVYEGQAIEDAEVLPSIGEKLPFNRKAAFVELLEMLNARIISRRFFRAEAAKIGYVFGDDALMEAEIVREEKALADALDPVGARLAEEATGGGEQA